MERQGIKDLKIEDYIRGARHGREAHDIELDAMRDGFLSEALDGFHASGAGPAGEHAAALERLAEGIGRSASAGRAAARARAVRVRERRVRGWSMAAASLFIAAVVGGGVWLVHNGIPAGDTRPALADHTDTSPGYYSGPVEKILPPVTVIPNDPEASGETLSEATDIAALQFDPEEIRALIDPDNVAAGGVGAANRGAAEAANRGAAGVATSEAANEITVAAEVEIAASSAVATPVAVPAPDADTVTTAAFRRHVREAFVVRGAVSGSVTLCFEVTPSGRPANITVVGNASPEAARAAKTLLSEGPDWPAEPANKLITIDL